MLHRLMVGQRILTPSILVRVQVKQPIKKATLAVAFLLADLPKVKNQAVRGATGAKVSVAMTQWRQPSELLSR